MLLSDGEGAGSAKDHQVQKRVGAQSVGTVNTCAGSLSTGVQPANHLILAVSVSDHLMAGKDPQCLQLQKKWCVKNVTYLALVVSGYASHVVVDGGQDGDGFFSDVHSGKDHCRLGDAGQPRGELLRRQVV